VGETINLHWSDPQTVLAIIGVGVAFLYTILTALIWYATWQNTKATKEILEAAHRPYLGIIGVEIQHEGLGGNITLAATVANVGSVPSRSVEVDLEIRINGRNSRRTGNTDAQVALSHGQSFPCTVILLPKEAYYINTSAGLEVQITVRYQGMAKKQYATYATYNWHGIREGFALSAGNFE